MVQLLVQFMAYGDHIFLRNNGIFYFRQVFQLGKHKKEIRISLNTRSREKAYDLAFKLHLKAQLRIRDSVEKIMDADELLSQLKQDLQKTVESHSKSDQDRFYRTFSEYEKKVDWVKEYVSNDFQGKSISDVINIYDEFHPLFEQVRIEKEGQIKASREAEILAKAKKFYDMADKQAISSELPQATQSPRLSQVISEYEEEMTTAGNWTEKTLQGYHSTFQLFIELSGDSHIDRITSSDIREFKKLLNNLPANHKKIPSVRDISAKDIVTQEHDIKTISVTSINKHITKISSMLGWAVKNGYIERNTARGLTIKQKKNKQDERSPFTNSELSQIFSDEEIYKEQKFKHSYYFWLPLLGLYTGARIDELCQLTVCDIQLTDGIYFIDINRLDDKKLKTESALRKIPIHSYLIKTGFIDFIKDSQKKGHLRVFNSIKPGRDGYGSAPSKWFGRQKVKLKLEHPEKKVFHSFRHNFSDALQAAGIPEQIAARLLGHQHSEISYGIYGSGANLKQLAEAIERIAYPIPELQKIEFQYNL